MSIRNGKMETLSHFRALLSELDKKERIDFLKELDPDIVYDLTTVIKPYYQTERRSRLNEFIVDNGISKKDFSHIFRNILCYSTQEELKNISSDKKQIMLARLIAKVFLKDFEKGTMSNTNKYVIANAFLDSEKNDTTKQYVIKEAPDLSNAEPSTQETSTDNKQC